MRIVYASHTQGADGSAGDGSRHDGGEGAAGGGPFAGDAAHSGAHDADWADCGARGSGIVSSLACAGSCMSLSGELPQTLQRSATGSTKVGVPRVGCGVWSGGGGGGICNPNTRAPAGCLLGLGLLPSKLRTALHTVHHSCACDLLPGLLIRRH